MNRPKKQIKKLETARFLSSEKNRNAGLAVLLAGFAAIGAVFLVMSHAATPSLSFEAEKGTTSGYALKIADSSASGSSAVKFGQAAPPPPVGPPPPPPSGVYRPFKANSYWNTPMPANAPIDPNSAVMIAESQNGSNTQNYMALTMNGSYGEPVYYSSASDPITTGPTDTGKTISVHIPVNAVPATGNDAQMLVYDKTPGYNRVVGIHHAKKVNGQWTGDGFDNYQLDSNGMDQGAGADDPLNGGHRGINGAARAFTYDEIAGGAANRRTEGFWFDTGNSGPDIFPMTGSEGKHTTGKVHEGMVIRIKPSINLASMGLTKGGMVVAKSLQQYGCVVGDTSGSGNRIKVQINANWAGLLGPNDLSHIPWSDYEFIKAGYDPVTNTIK